MNHPTDRSSKRSLQLGVAVAIAVAVWAAVAAGATSPEGQPAPAPSLTQSPTPSPAFAVEVTGEGPPMILIPGLASSGEVWDATVEHYRGRHRLHVLTLAGFAGQPPIEPPLLAAARDQLVAYVEAMGPAVGHERPVLVGHSLGAFVAFGVAAAVPNRVAAVVAVDGVPFLPALYDPQATAAGAAAQAEPIRQLYASLTPEQLALQSRMALAAMITDPADVETALAWSAASSPAAVGEAMAELLTTDLRESLAAIEAPVLLIAAAGTAEDEAAREGLRESYQAQLRHARHGRVVLATGARHFVMLDDPAFLHAAIDELLAGLPRGAR